MTTITAPASTPLVPAVDRPSVIARIRDRHRRAAEDRRTRRAVARAMADSPTAAGARELQLLLLK